MPDFARIVFVVTMLAGGASLGRLGESFADLGVLGEFRFIALALLLPLAALIALAAQQHPRQPSSPGIWLMLVFLLHGWVALSWGWSERTAFGASQLYEVALLLAALSVAPILFRDDPRRSTLLVLAAFYGVAVAFTAISLLLTGRLQGEIAALGGGIGTARILGPGVVAGTFFALRTSRVIWFLPVPLLIAGMLLTGSRAAVLALVPALLLLWWKRRAVVQPRNVLRQPASTGLVRGVIAIAVLGAFFAAPVGRDMATKFVLSNVAGPGRTQSVETELYLADRDVIFLDAWTRFAAEPLRGLGLGTYVGPFGELYPHNLLLGFAVDAGSLALLLCIGLLAYPLLRGWRGKDALGIGALAAAVFFGVASLFAGTYYDSRLVWACLLLVLLLRNVDDGTRGMSSAVYGRLELGANPRKGVGCRPV